MKKMKRMLALLLAALMVFSVVGCGGDNNGGGSSDTEELYSEARTLNVALTSEPASMDPTQTIDTWSDTVFTNIYETLMEVNEKGEIVPKLAESYEASADGLTYTFKLKKGVKFHNGEEMKASDVAFSFNRAKEAAILKSVTADFDNVEATDDYTVVFHLNKVSAPFMSNMTYVCLCVLSEKAVTEAGEEYYKSPIGTGPYKFEKWDQGVELDLTYFEDYWGDTPDFTKVKLRFIPEATSRTIELEAGSVDLITDVAATDLSRVEEGENMALATAVGMAIRLMAMNCSKAPLDDVRVRQAIAYAIDCEAINQAMNLGHGTVATAPISDAVMFHSEVGKNEFNIEKAKELLAEAGYPDGLDITLSTDTRKEYSDVCVILQQQLAKANIRVTLDNTEWAVFLDKAYQGDTQLFMLGYSCSTPDPDALFYSCFHSANIGPQGGMAYLSDPEVDQLIDASRTELDNAKRTELYEQLQAKLAELKPWVYLYNTTVNYGINTAKIAEIKVAGSSVQPYYNIKRVK